MFLGVLLPTVAAVFIVFCLGRSTWPYSRGVDIVVDDVDKMLARDVSSSDTNKQGL